jgi:ABC-type antimicrobial peptide transport system permease subunit
VTLAATGAALGLIAVAVLGRLLRSLLFQVSPTDPASVVAAVAVLALAALAGCVLPARRATSVDPLIALRSD